MQRGGSSADRCALRLDLLETRAQRGELPLEVVLFALQLQRHLGELHAVQRRIRGGNELASVLRLDLSGRDDTEEERRKQENQTPP